jgi:RimJ/RimL family protein N-acetyltransferase
MTGRPLTAPFEGASLALVAPLLRHAGDSLRWVSDPDVCRLMGMDFSNVSLEGEQARIRQLTQTDDGIYWFIRLDGQLVGNASLHSFAKDRERYGVKAGTYTIMIGDRPSQGRGVGTAVTRAVFDWAFGEGGFELVVARVAEQNAPSLGIMRKLGLSFAGTTPNRQGTPADVQEWQLWEIRKEDWKK